MPLRSGLRSGPDEYQARISIGFGLLHRSSVTLTTPRLLQCHSLNMIRRLLAVAPEIPLASKGAVWLVSPAKSLSFKPPGAHQPGSPLQIWLSASSQEQAVIWLEGKGHIVAAVIAILTGASFLLWMMT